MLRQHSWPYLSGPTCLDLLVLERERVDREIRPRIGPYGDGVPPRAARERAEGVERVLVAVLGVDGLAGAEVDRAPGDSHLLPFLAGEVHLDAVTLGIVEGFVAEARQVEIGAELAVDAREQVEIGR